MIFSVLPLCFKRYRYISGKGRRNEDEDDDYYENFQSLSPTISLREAKRPPRAGGQLYGRLSALPSLILAQVNRKSTV